MPPKIKADLVEGPGGGAPDISEAVEFHYAGPQGVFIEIHRGGVRLPSTESEPIAVMGKTSKFYTIEDGFGSEFHLAAGACGTYEVNVYGVEREEIRKFLEFLQAR